jgi:hypothetical protein
MIPASIICGIKAIGTKDITFSAVETVADNNKPIRVATKEIKIIHNEASIGSLNSGVVPEKFRYNIPTNKND